MPELRVATYNLYLGADVTVIFSLDAVGLAATARRVLRQVEGTDFPGRAAAIAALLVRERVDVVGLQEVARWARPVETDRERRSGVWLDFLTELLSALATAGEVYEVRARTTSFRGGAHVQGEALSVLGHNVILVRRTSGVIVTAERTGVFAKALAVPTAVPTLEVDIARSWGWVDAELDGRPFRFVNTHLEAWDADVRGAQRDELLAAIGTPDRPVVLVGDLNAPPEAVGRPEGYVDAWEVAGEGGTGDTCGRTADLADATSTLRERIDYVWVRGATVRDCRVVGARPEDRTASGLWPSDHAGVVADLEL